MDISNNYLNPAESAHSLREKNTENKAKELGRYPLEQMFVQQLQSTIWDESEEGEGSHKEFIPFLVKAVFENAPDFGIGNIIHSELKKNNNI